MHNERMSLAEARAGPLHRQVLVRGRGSHDAARALALEPALAASHRSAWRGRPRPPRRRLHVDTRALAACAPRIPLGRGSGRRYGALLLPQLCILGIWPHSPLGQALPQHIQRALRSITRPGGRCSGSGGMQLTPPGPSYVITPCAYLHEASSLSYAPAPPRHLPPPPAARGRPPRAWHAAGPARWVGQPGAWESGRWVKEAHSFSSWMHLDNSPRPTAALTCHRPSREVLSSACTHTVDGARTW